MPFGDSLMASTKRTHTFTKGKMNIKTDAFLGIRLGKTFPYCCFPFFTGKRMNIPKRYCWITGIPRTWNIVFLNKTAHSWFKYGTNLALIPTKKYDNCQVPQYRYFNRLFNRVTLKLPLWSLPNGLANSSQLI